MAKHGGKGFLLTTKIYKSTNISAILAPNNRNPEGKAAPHLEATAYKKQENMTTRQLTTRTIYANGLHMNIGHPRENSMRATAKNLYYRVKGTLEVYEDYAMNKINHKLLRKAMLERHLNPSKMIYLDIISQNKPSYWGSNNWILIQDSYTNQKCSFFTKSK